MRNVYLRIVSYHRVQSVTDTNYTHRESLTLLTTAVNFIITVCGVYFLINRREEKLAAVAPTRHCTVIEGATLSNIRSRPGTMMWEVGAAQKDILPAVTMSKILQLPFVRLTITRKQIVNKHSAFP